MSVEVITLYNRIPAIVAGLAHAAAKGIDASTAVIEQAVKDNAPIDTGGMQASTYRITEETNGYADAVAAGMALNPGMGVSDQPERGEGEAIVGVAADYAGYVNDGTSHQAAQPFFSQAVVAHEDAPVESIRSEIEKLAMGI